MGRGKKYQPEQVVNLLRQIEVAVANGEDDGPGIEGSRDRGADVLSMAQGVRRAASGPGETAEGVGAGELEAEAFGGQPEPG